MTLYPYRLWIEVEHWCRSLYSKFSSRRWVLSIIQPAPQKKATLLPQWTNIRSPTPLWVFIPLNDALCSHLFSCFHVFPPANFTNFSHCICGKNYILYTLRLASHSLFPDWTGAGEKGLVTLGYSLCKSGMLLNINVTCKLSRCVKS